MVVSCTIAGFSAAGYPSNAQGKLISGKYARNTSVAIHKNGAANSANDTLRCAILRTASANNPIAPPHTLAIRNKTPQPAAADIPPCIDNVSAIHGTHVATKNIACKYPHANATLPLAPRMLDSSNAM